MVYTGQSDVHSVKLIVIYRGLILGKCPSPDNSDIGYVETCTRCLECVCFKIKYFGKFG